MEIQNGKLIKLTKEEIRTLLDDDFINSCDSINSIKKDGILDYILNLSTETELKIQALIGYIAEISNPENVEGKWQDALYERIGVKRLPPQKARFSAEIHGIPDTTIMPKSLLLAGNNFNYEFTNDDTFTFDTEGIANVVFSSVEHYGNTIIDESGFVIVRAPSAVISIDNSTVTNIFSGQTGESDDAYRIRFRNSKALSSNATHKANLANLSKYVDNSAMINIIDKNSDINMSPNFVKIVVQHNTTDEVFAQAVLDTFGSGIIFLGDTSVSLKDILNNNVTIKFQKAESVSIYLKIKIITQTGINEEILFGKVKSAISDYFRKRGFGLGDTLYATEFIIPALSVTGVEAVSEISVKRASDENYTDIINLAYDEVPEINESQIITEGA